MKKLAIHIGVHKTGTTAIQLFLRDNKKVLKEKYGIYYPMVENDRFYFQHDAIAKMLKRDKIDDVRFFLTEAKNEGDTVLLSSESFSGWRKVAKNLSFAKQLFDDIEIIVYLRRQDLWLESVYQQFIKTGQLSSSDTFPVWTDRFLQNFKGMYSCNWSKEIGFWSDVFGKENVIVRVYEKSQFKNGNIIEDFLTQLNPQLDKSNFTFNKQFQNRSFNKHATDFLRLFNDAEDFEKWVQLLNVWIKNPFEKTGEVYFSFEKRMEIMELFKQSNEEIARNFLNKPDGILFKEPLPTNEGYPPVFKGLDKKRLLIEMESLKNYLDFAVNNLKK